MRRARFLCVAGGRKDPHQPGAGCVLPNSDGHWRPGLFITAHIAVNEIEAPLVVPKTALQTVEEKPCVFVQTQEGFEPRHVTLDRSNETQCRDRFGTHRRRAVMP